MDVWSEEAIEEAKEERAPGLSAGESFRRRKEQLFGDWCVVSFSVWGALLEACIYLSDACLAIVEACFIFGSMFSIVGNMFIVLAKMLIIFGSIFSAPVRLQNAQQVSKPLEVRDVSREAAASLEKQQTSN